MLDDKSYQKTWKSCFVQWPWWFPTVRSSSEWNWLLAASSGMLTFPKSSSRFTNCARSSSRNRSVCLSVCMSLFLSVCLSVCLSVSLSVRMTVCFHCFSFVSSVCLFVFCLFIYLIVWVWHWKKKLYTCLVCKRRKAITKELLSDAIRNQFHRNICIYIKFGVILSLWDTTLVICCQASPLTAKLQWPEDMW